MIPKKESIFCMLHFAVSRRFQDFIFLSSFPHLFFSLCVVVTFDLIVMVSTIIWYYLTLFILAGIEETGISFGPVEEGNVDVILVHKYFSQTQRSFSHLCIGF